ncbi:MAG: hypothetical protein HYX85_00350 [Chloroflexi bacterium]|nr:hypothetical protein [Chloroflexota bacterium]
MTTQSGDTLEQEIKKVLEPLAPFMAVMTAGYVMRGLNLLGVEGKVETELGRKLTDEERALCREECQRRIAAGLLPKFSSDEHVVQERVRGVIRHVVWGEEL